MKQLKEQNMIGNNMASFYVRGKNDSYSHIKFGSWDKSKTQGMVYRQKTRLSTKDWEIESISASDIDERIIKEMRYLDFDPAFPNTYVPNEDWTAVIYNWLFKIFPGNDKFVYSEQDNHAYYKDTCENLKAKLIKDDRLKYLSITFDT